MFGEAELQQLSALESWVHFFTLALTSWVNLAKLLNTLNLGILIRKWVITVSQGCKDN